MIPACRTYSAPLSESLSDSQIITNGGQFSSYGCIMFLCEASVGIEITIGLADGPEQTPEGRSHQNKASLL